MFDRARSGLAMGQVLYTTRPRVKSWTTDRPNHHLHRWSNISTKVHNNNFQSVVNSRYYFQSFPYAPLRPLLKSISNLVLRVWGRERETNMVQNQAWRQTSAPIVLRRQSRTFVFVFSSDGCRTLLKFKLNVFLKKEKDGRMSLLGRSWRSLDRAKDGREGI